LLNKNEISLKTKTKAKAASTKAASAKAANTTAAGVDNQEKRKIASLRTHPCPGTQRVAVLNLHRLANFRGDGSSSGRSRDLRKLLGV
jgi:hypothetical protein